MLPIFKEAENLSKQKQPFVLATVVRTQGSTPQKPGAKLLVPLDGKGIGTLGGGCVEAEAWSASQQALKEGTGASLQSFDLNEDLATKDGLVCGGTMDIMIDPIRNMVEFTPWVAQIMDALDGGKAVGMATLTKPLPGMPEESIGSKLFIREDGYREGTLGDHDLDIEAADVATELMTFGKERYVKKNGAEFYVETFTSPPTILIAGGGHVAKALYTLGKPLGFRFTIVDDRSQFANVERFPEAEKVIVEEFDKGIASAGVTPNTFIVIATRGHKFDSDATLAAVKTPAKYVGLLGSKRKNILIFRNLFAEGISAERIKEIRAPIGLDLGGRTPEEIALAILAEMVMFRLGGGGKPLHMDEKLIMKAKDQADKLKNLPEAQRKAALEKLD